MVNAQKQLLTDEQVQQFRVDGYLRFGRVIGDDEVEQMRSDLTRLIRRELTQAEKSVVPPEMSFGNSLDGSGQYADWPIHQYLNMWKVFPAYRRAVNHPAITSVVRQLMGVPGVRIWHDQVISKPPNENKHFANHHDFYFWPLDRPTMISCWLALDDATPDNGCMHVVPHSHRDPRYQPPDCDLAEDIHLSPLPGGPEPPGSLYADIRTWMPDRALPVPLKAGECMFHHCLNYHMTPENNTSRQRRAFVMIFMPDGTRYNRVQEPNHPCTSYLPLEHGQVLGGPGFPVVGL